VSISLTSVPACAERSERVSGNRPSVARNLGAGIISKSIKQADRDQQAFLEAQEQLKQRRTGA